MIPACSRAASGSRATAITKSAITSVSHHCFVGIAIALGRIASEHAIQIAFHLDATNIEDNKFTADTLQRIKNDACIILERLAGTPQIVECERGVDYDRQINLSGRLSWLYKISHDFSEQSDGCKSRQLRHELRFLVAEVVNKSRANVSVVVR